MPEGHYHFRTKLISRSQGRSICAAAAYRSGEKIKDEHYGKTFDYTPRTSIHATEIRAPNYAPDWMKDRSELWNGVEEFETRKNSRLAREFEVSIPQELTAEQRKQAVRDFVDSELVSRGMVADVCYHDFTGRHSHNPHAHILVTTREIEGNSFSKKKTREWDKEETLLHWREAWAKHANRALEQAKSQTRVDHRSYKERGITKTPVSESGGAWHIRQKEITATRQQLDAINQEAAALDQERKRQQTAAIQTGLAIGRMIAREQQTRKEAPQPAPQPEATPPSPVPPKKPAQGLEPWRRDWERQNEAQRQQRTVREKEQERKAAISRKEAAQEKPRLKPKGIDAVIQKGNELARDRAARNAEQKQQKSQQSPAPYVHEPPPAQPAGTDEKQRIKQLLDQQTDRERGKSRATGQPDQAAKPARDISLEQQTAKLKESMAAFDVEVEKLRHQQESPRRKREPPKPEPPKQQEPQPEKRHERGIGR